MSQKLTDPSTKPKTYWKIINRFVNNRKTPMIPTLLVNDKIISNISEKANLFNKFFASQCTHLENNSSLPLFCLKTEKSLSSLEINESDVFAIIKNLDPNKPHAWDDLSIRMIKLCSKSITYPWNLYLKHRCEKERFQVTEKKLKLCQCTNRKIKKY